MWESCSCSSYYKLKRVLNGLFLLFPMTLRDLDFNDDMIFLLDP